MKTEDDLYVNDLLDDARAANLPVLARRLHELGADLSNYLGMLQDDVAQWGSVDQNIAGKFETALANLKKQSGSDDLAGTIPALLSVVDATDSILEIGSKRSKDELGCGYSRHLKRIVYYLLNLAESSLDESVRDKVLRLAYNARGLVEK